VSGMKNKLVFMYARAPLKGSPKYVLGTKRKGRAVAKSLLQVVTSKKNKKRGALGPRVTRGEENDEANQVEGLRQ